MGLVLVTKGVMQTTEATVQCVVGLGWEFGDLV